MAPRGHLACRRGGPLLDAAGHAGEPPEGHVRFAKGADAIDLYQRADRFVAPVKMVN
jgi:hypothetical protein